VKIAEDITEKIKDVGEEGLELSKEVLAEISEKATDITNIARYKLELNEKQKKINSEMKNLGELVFVLSSSKRKEKKELPLPKEALISAIKRNDEVIIPDGNTKILANDLVTIIGKKNDVIKVKNKLSIK
jgi:NhaP-type Na+/H+ and K+/H+ antiporter